MDISFAGPELFTLPESASIRQVLEKINLNSGLPVLLVSDRKLVSGVVTDGDVRRRLLAGANLDDSIGPSETSFVSVGSEQTVQEAESLFLSRRLDILPIVSGIGELVGAWVPSYPTGPIRELTALVMAGGRGRRMRPLTDTLPKPLIRVNNKALIDYALEACIRHGVKKAFVSLNYLKEMIAEYLATRKYGLEIELVNEEIELGTAGPVSLLPRIENDLLLVNADVIHDVDIGAMHRFHIKSGADLTVATKFYETQVPFGVLDLKERKILGVDEKPTVTMPISGGIYILSEKARRIVPKQSFFDMPDLINEVAIRGLEAVAFFAHELLLDVGTPQSLRVAESSLPRPFTSEH